MSQLVDTALLPRVAAENAPLAGHEDEPSDFSTLSEHLRGSQ